MMSSPSHPHPYGNDAPDAPRVPMPGWQAPPTSWPQDPPDPRAETTTAASSAPTTISEAADVAEDSASAAGKSSPASTKDLLAAHRGKVLAAQKIAGGVFMAAGGLLNHRLRLDERDRTWIPDDEDVKSVAEPLGRIAARRLPMPDGTSQASDLMDGIEALIGVVSYALLNVQRRVQKAQQLDRNAPRVYDNEDRGMVPGEPVAETTTTWQEPPASYTPTYPPSYSEPVSSTVDALRPWSPGM